MGAAKTNANGKPITWDWVKLWLPMLAMLVGLSMAWATMGLRIGAVEARQAEQQTKIDANNAVLVEIRVQLAGIARDIVYIRERLDQK